MTAEAYPPTLPGAIATMAAALDTYRLTTPAEQQTPHGAAQQIAADLAASGWVLHLAGEDDEQPPPPDYPQPEENPWPPGPLA